MIKGLPSSIDVTSIFDKKTLKIELGALYAMIPEYIFSKDDIGHCDVLICMPVYINKDLVTLYIVGYEYNQLTPTDFVNNHLTMTFVNDGDEKLAIDTSAEELYRYAITMPRSGSNIIRVGPLTVSTFDFTLCATTDDIQHAVMHPIGYRIKDMRQWPRKAVETWVGCVNIEYGQYSTAIAMDQKYKVIAYAQEMFVQRASDFNPVATEKVKQGRLKKESPHDDIFQAGIIEEAAPMLAVETSELQVKLTRDCITNKYYITKEYHGNPAEQVPSKAALVGESYNQPTSIQDAEWFSPRYKESRQFIQTYKTADHSTVHVRLSRIPFFNRDMPDDLASIKLIATIDVVDGRTGKLHLKGETAHITLDVMNGFDHIMADDLAVFIINNFVIVRVKNCKASHPYMQVNLEYIEAELERVRAEMTKPYSSWPTNFFDPTGPAPDPEPYPNPAAEIKLYDPVKYKSPDEIREDLLNKDAPDDAGDKNCYYGYACGDVVKETNPESPPEVFEEENERDE